MLNWRSWSNFVLEGGTTGHIVYVENILLSDITKNNSVNIAFNTVPNDGVWMFGTTMSLYLGDSSENLLAYNGQVSPATDSAMSPRIALGSYTVYNAKSSGGFAGHGGVSFACTGSYGSQDATAMTGTNSTGYMQPAGAPGGDGKFGFRYAYESTFGGFTTNPITSAKIIPISSIFGGTSKGRAGHINTNSGQRIGARAYGGAGYGNSREGAEGTVQKAGYGCGQASSPADEDAGNQMLAGDGIVCLYYHDEPI